MSITMVSARPCGPRAGPGSESIVAGRAGALNNAVVSCPHRRPPGWARIRVDQGGEGRSTQQCPSRWVSVLPGLCGPRARPGTVSIVGTMVGALNNHDGLSPSITMGSVRRASVAPKPDLDPSRSRRGG